MKTIVFIAFLAISTVAFAGCMHSHLGHGMMMDMNGGMRASMMEQMPMAEKDSAMRNPMMEHMMSMTQKDTAMRNMMMDHMMMMAEKNPAMRHMMMDKMMTMAEKDASMRSEMMRMMMAKPSLAKEMKKAAEGVQDNLEHSKHHPPVDKIEKNEEPIHRH